MNLINSVSRPQELLSFLNSMNMGQERMSDSKFGILQVKKNINPLLPFIIEMLKLLFVFMISLISILSRSLKLGLKSQNQKDQLTSFWLLSAIKLIELMTNKFPTMKQKSTLSRQVQFLSQQVQNKEKEQMNYSLQQQKDWTNQKAKIQQTIGKRHNQPQRVGLINKRKDVAAKIDQIRCQFDCIIIYIFLSFNSKASRQLSLKHYILIINLIFIVTHPMAKKRAVKKTEKKSNPLFQSRPRNFRVGNNIQPKRNLTRFVRWPKYITFQRQKRILLTRIKVPPLIAQFSRALDKNQTNVLFRLLKKYSPEDTKQKKARLVQEAKDKAEKKTVQKSRPYHLKFGLNHVTKLVEEKKAKLVVIASNVDPIELVVWLPTLCRKLDIPYCFVKGKARLGQLVHQKNAAVVALTEVRKEDEGDLTNLTTAFRTNFNQNDKLRKEIGGFRKGTKSQAKFDRVTKQKERETIQKNQ